MIRPHACCDAIEGWRILQSPAGENPRRPRCLFIRAREGKSGGIPRPLRLPLLTRGIAAAPAMTSSHDVYHGEGVDIGADVTM